MNEQKVTCKEVMEHICENLNEGIDSPKCAAIREHLNNCDNCRKYFSNINDTIGLYRHCSEDLPEGAHKRLSDILGLNE